MAAFIVSNPDREVLLTTRSYFRAKKSLLAFWPAVAATILFLILIGRHIISIKAAEGGHFVYVLDDSYAHLAIAKNLLQHGVWTFNAADGFESGSSSLLWPVLIAFCAIFGVHEYIPLVLNILAVVGLMFYAGRAIRRITDSGVLNLLILCCIVVLTPLETVVATGMEHSLQILLSLVFVDLAAKLLMDDSSEATTPRTPGWLCVTGVLLVLTRYEGLFLIAAVGLLVLCRGRWKLAVTLGVATTVPLILFGSISVYKGWYFLPNSLMLKGNTQMTMTLAGILMYLRRGYDLMLSQQHMFILIAGASAALLGSLQHHRSLWRYPVLVLLITLIAAVQHLQFASLGWFYRYEAYLIVLILFGVGVTLSSGRPTLTADYRTRPATPVYLSVLALTALLFGAPLWNRAMVSDSEIDQASYNIYEQQYQMARFVRKFYRSGSLIANDVGFISFMGDDIRLLDTAGLSSIDVLRATRKAQFNAQTVRRLSQRVDAQVAIVFPRWASVFYQGPLPEWIKVGCWIIPHNLVCGEDKVAFYATSSAQVPKLLSALQQFSSELPKDVQQEGLYRGAYSVNDVGTYGPEGPEAGHFYWTHETAQFDVYPADDQVLKAEDTTLRLTIFTISPNQTIQVFFNGELVETKVIPLAESQRWSTFAVKARWHAGRNIVKLIGHGDTVKADRDPRPLLFATLDPRKTVNDAGATVPQRTVQQAAND